MSKRDLSICTKETYLYAQKRPIKSLGGARERGQREGENLVDIEERVSRLGFRVQGLGFRLQVFHVTPTTKYRQYSLGSVCALRAFFFRPNFCLTSKNTFQETTSTKYKHYICVCGEWVFRISIWQKTPIYIAKETYIQQQSMGTISVCAVPGFFFVRICF